MTEVKQKQTVYQGNFICLWTAQNQTSKQVAYKLNKRVTKHVTQRWCWWWWGKYRKRNWHFQSCPPCTLKFHWCMGVKITVQTLPCSLLYPSFTDDCFIFALSVMVKLKRKGWRQTCDKMNVLKLLTGEGTKTQLTGNKSAWWIYSLSFEKNPFGVCTFH